MDAGIGQRPLHMIEEFRLRIVVIFRSLEIKDHFQHPGRGILMDDTRIRPLARVHVMPLTGFLIVSFPVTFIGQSTPSQIFPQIVLIFNCFIIGALKMSRCFLGLIDQQQYRPQY